jgi:hypothetical protein
MLSSRTSPILLPAVCALLLANNGCGKSGTKNFADGAPPSDGPAHAGGMTSAAQSSAGNNGSGGAGGTTGMGTGGIVIDAGATVVTSAAGTTQDGPAGNDRTGSSGGAGMATGDAGGSIRGGATGATSAISGATAMGGIPGSGGMAGRTASCQNSSGTIGTVSALVPTIETLLIEVNRNDGFVGPAKQTDVWSVTVATRAVALNAGAPVVATAEQIQALIDAVAPSTYQFNYTCCGNFIYADGGAMSPLLTVSGGGATHTFGVSGRGCAYSSHSYKGDVLTCTAYEPIYTLLETIVPSGVAS